MSRILRAEMRMYTDEVSTQEEVDRVWPTLRDAMPHMAIKTRAGVVGTMEAVGLSLEDDGTTIVIDLSVDMVDIAEL